MSEPTDQNQADQDQARRDRELGMHRAITRRDFVNGVPVSIGALALPDLAMALGGLQAGEANAGNQNAAEKEFAPGKAPGYYPPALMGIRGNHDGAVGDCGATRVEPAI